MRILFPGSPLTPVQMDCSILFTVHQCENNFASMLFCYKVLLGLSNLVQRKGPGYTTGTISSCSMRLTRLAKTPFPRTVHPKKLKSFK